MASILSGLDTEYESPIASGYASYGNYDVNKASTPKAGAAPGIRNMPEEYNKVRIIQGADTGGFMTDEQISASPRLSELQTKDPDLKFATSESYRNMAARARQRTRKKNARNFAAATILAFGTGAYLSQPLSGAAGAAGSAGAAGGLTGEGLGLAGTTAGASGGSTLGGAGLTGAGINLAGTEAGASLGSSLPAISGASNAAGSGSGWWSGVSNWINQNPILSATIINGISSALSPDQEDLLKLQSRLQQETSQKNEDIRKQKYENMGVPSGINVAPSKRPLYYLDGQPVYDAKGIINSGMRR